MNYAIRWGRMTSDERGLFNALGVETGPSHIAFTRDLSRGELADVFSCVLALEERTPESEGDHIKFAIGGCLNEARRLYAKRGRSKRFNEQFIQFSRMRMLRKAFIERARAVVARQVQDLTRIEEEAKQSSDYGLSEKRLDRWRRRTERLIKEHFDATEAKKFEEEEPGGYAIGPGRPDPLVAKMKEYKEHLQALSEDLNDHADDFLRSVLEQPPNGESKVRREPARIGVKHYDVFIAHASEDRDECVRPLSKLLKRRLSVWLDEGELTVGDSLLAKINQGISQSKYGVVVLSPSFFRKSWPQRELDGLISLEERGRKVVLPVWHHIGLEGVRKFSPVLAGRVAAKTKEGLLKVASDITKAVGIIPRNETPSHIRRKSSRKRIWREEERLVDSRWWESSKLKKTYEAKRMRGSWSNPERVEARLGKGYEIVIDEDKKRRIRYRFVNKDGQVLVCRKQLKNSHSGWPKEGGSCI